MDFPVVGIGASAGGLEAIQEFFRELPEKPGASFVVVQHLSPDYKSFMSELLARHTKITIKVVEDGMEIEENHIYLIPPKMNMTIFHGKLFLNEISDERTLNLPIDIFLRSLAKDQEKNAIAIILSGTGSDGALGIRAIKEYGGMTMSQDHKSAKFDGMPRSSAATGMIDFVLPPKRLAAELMEFFKHPFVKKTKQIEDLISSSQNQLSKVIGILRDEKGVDFTLYKENTIIRRLEKRISINRFTKIEEYVKFLARNKREVDILFNELLIGVTRFFRDEESFAVLKNIIIPKILDNINTEKEIRIWTPGCSTGEEAYSIAILFAEYLSEKNIKKEVKIFATDLDTHSLEYAGTGYYPGNIISDVSPERLSRYFIKKEDGYQVNETIRSMIIFARHNLLEDPPFSKIDLISCRNLLIYLNSDTQQKVISMFHVSLKSHAYLFLGNSESLGKMAEGYETIDSKCKIFQKGDKYRPGYIHNYNISNGVHKNAGDLKSISSYVKNIKPKSFMQSGIIDAILSDYLPPSVIIDEYYDILHSIHNVGKYVSLPVGQVSLNLLKMLPREQSVIVSSLIRRSEKNPSGITIDNINFSADNDMQLSISCKKLNDELNHTAYYLISFIEKKKEKKLQQVEKIERLDLNSQYRERIIELEKELQFKSENLQATVEELETSNEELQSSNEELIASNEELQSTNEELQSVNEELYTVNSEHIRKIEELTELNADFDNLLRNTQVGNLYLDRHLNIRKINDVASQLTNILSSDIGRPIEHLSVNSLYPDFLNDIEKVTTDLQPIEREIREKYGQWYLMRILPYRTAENAIDGIIITFVDITRLKSSQERVIELSQRLEKSLDLGEMSWWEWDVKTNEVYTGNAKYEMLGYDKEDIPPGFEGWTCLLHPDDYEGCMQAMRDHMEGKADVYFSEYRIRHKDGHYLWYRDKGGVASRDEKGKPSILMGIVMNITKEKSLAETHKTEIDQASNQLKQEIEKYNLLYKSMTQGVVFQNAEGFVTDANPAAENILGLSLADMQNRNSENPEWKSLKTDGSEYPGEEHPSMLALKNKKIYKDKVMGVYNPSRKTHVWINITAIPLFQEGERNPWQVYTIFDEVDAP